MECGFLSLMALLVGVFLIFCVKPEEKFNVFAIISLIALGTFAIPLFNSLSLGNISEINTGYQLFSQGLKIIIDPLSAFIGTIFILSLLFYILKLFIDNYKQKLFMPEVLMLMVFLLVFMFSVQNSMYFLIAYFAVNGILLFWNMAFNDGKNFSQFKQLSLYTLNFCVFIAIMMLSVLSNDCTFPSIVKHLVNNSILANTAFCLLATGFGIPFLFSNKLFFTTDSLCAYKHNELIIRSLFYIICFYGLLRFISMGVAPNVFCNTIIVSGIIAFTVIKLLQLIKCNNILHVYTKMYELHTILVVLSVIVGINGYLFKVPLIAILGFIAAFMLMINVLLCSYSLERDIVVDDKKETICADKLSLVGMYSYSCLPFTLGFASLYFLAGAFLIGIFTANIYLRVFSWCVLFFVVAVIICQLYKIIRIMKKCYIEEGSNYVGKLNRSTILFSGLIILTGIFPQVLFKFIQVPVSYLVGGTKYIEIFKAVYSFLNTWSIYCLGFIGLIAAYIIVKILVLRFLKPHSKV